MKNKTLNPTAFPVTVSVKPRVIGKANTHDAASSTPATMDPSTPADLLSTPTTIAPSAPADLLTPETIPPSTQADLLNTRTTTGGEDNTPLTLGYIRVSSRDQNEARQLDAMNEFGVDKIYTDKQSGKDFNRPAYIQLMADLRPGDILVVKSIDRLGRNYDEILEQWRMITKEKQAAIVVLDMPLLDTRNSRDLTGTLIADIVLQLLSYVAETERQFIKQRQKEGIAAAKARGQRFGRPCFERPEDYWEVLKLWQEHKISANKACKRLGVHHTTFKKWAKADTHNTDPGSCVEINQDSAEIDAGGAETNHDSVESGHDIAVTNADSTTTTADHLEPTTDSTEATASRDDNT